MVFLAFPFQDYCYLKFQLAFSHFFHTVYLLPVSRSALVRLFLASLVRKPRLRSFTGDPYLVDVGVVEVAEARIGPQHHRPLRPLQLVLPNEVQINTLFCI
jgi:hypothetical protein